MTALCLTRPVSINWSHYTIGNFLPDGFKTILNRYFLQLGLNVKVISEMSTGSTRNKLISGREVNILADLMVPPKQKHPKRAEEYVNDLVAQIRKAHEVAMKSLKTS